MDVTIRSACCAVARSPWTWLGRVAAQVHDVRAEDRVGDQATARRLDHDGGVAQPRDPHVCAFSGDAAMNSVITAPG